jgi:hypothetical protein
MKSTTRNMNAGRITAEVISCPGQLGSPDFAALQLNVAGFVSPYVLTLTLRAIGYRALSEQADPADLFKALAVAVNGANLAVRVTTMRIGG